MLRMISNALGRPHSTRPSSPRQCEKALPPRPEQQVSLRGQLSFGELEIRKRAMQTFKYSDLLQHLEPFDDWLRTLGLTPRREDRIHQAFETPRMADAASRAGRETRLVRASTCRRLEIAGSHGSLGRTRFAVISGQQEVLDGLQATSQ